MLASPEMFSSWSRRSASTRAISWRSPLTGSRPGGTGCGGSRPSSACASPLLERVNATVAATPPLVIASGSAAALAGAAGGAAGAGVADSGCSCAASAGGGSLASSSSAFRRASMSVSAVIAAGGAAGDPGAERANSTSGDAAAGAGAGGNGCGAVMGATIASAAGEPSGRERSWMRVIIARAGGTRRPLATCSRIRASSSRLAWTVSNSASLATTVPLSTCRTRLSNSWLRSPIAVMPAMRAPPLSVCSGRLSARR